VIRVDGVELSARGVDLNRARKDIGMVFQAFNLYPHLTALGNVALALRKVLRMSRQEAEARGGACSSGWGSPTRPPPTRASCRAASSSESPSRAPSPSSRS